MKEKNTINYQIHAEAHIKFYMWIKISSFNSKCFTIKTTGYCKEGWKACVQGIKLIMVLTYSKPFLGLRPLVKIYHTSEAHSCRVPTTGISIFSCVDLSSRASRGIAPAFLMASLFFLLLLQLHRARAPHRATWTSICNSAVMWPVSGAQSRRPT